MQAVAMLALFAGASACSPPDAAVDPSCIGSKCDDPIGPPTPHALAVWDCEQTRDDALAAASSSEELAALEQYRQCLVEVDNSAISRIEQNLLAAGKLARSHDEILGVFEEFRYASLCTDIESISSFVGDDLALVFERCAATRERALAHVVSALVDYTGERSSVLLNDQREHFSACYLKYDEVVSQSSDSSEQYAARQELVSCAGDDLRDHAGVLKDAFCERVGCPDELLIASFILAGFETAIDTSSQACQVLVDASIYQDVGGFQQALNCQLSVYAQLRVAVVDGLQE